MDGGAQASERQSCDCHDHAGASRPAALDSLCFERVESVNSSTYTSMMKVGLMKPLLKQGDDLQDPKDDYIAQKLVDQLRAGLVSNIFFAFHRHDL